MLREGPFEPRNFKQKRMKRILYYFFQSIGAVWLLRLLDRNAVSILMLHGIMDLDKAKEWIPLRTPFDCRQLEASLKILSKFFQFISLDEAVDMLCGRKAIKPHRIAVSFDDGYRNQVKYAIPILKKFKAPATIFIVTENTNYQKPFWFDRLDYAIQQCGTDKMDLSIGTANIKLQLQTWEEMQRSFKLLRTAAKMQEFPESGIQQQMELLAERLEEKSHKRLADIFESDECTGLLTWDEIRQASKDKDIVFGSHSVNHQRLGLADPAEVQYQLEESKKAIELHTGLECIYFCYPNGSFNRQVAEMVSKCGYRAAVTTLPGCNQKGSDLFTLKRIHPPLDENRHNILWQIHQIQRLKNPMKMLISRQYPIEFIQGD